MFADRHISYKETRSFSPIVIDYLKQDARLQAFYDWHPSPEVIREAVRKKSQQPVNRPLLVQVLKEQYKSLNASGKTLENIDRLVNENTYTITTAHQPNLFTGPLYFMYKILHAIKIAEELNKLFAGYHFVPVYYMGSEDADFAELNHTYVDGKKIEWKKEQKGAVGRMKVDATLELLIEELEGQLGIEPFGKEVIGLLRKSYAKGKTIQDATFELVNELYGRFGLVVLIPDHPSLKAQMKPVFENELFAEASYSIVKDTSEALDQHYGAQAFARKINLFYLKDDIRERIERTGNGFEVLQTGIRFTEEEMKKELEEHPERFSPNVILRGLYQETILPNICFVGGGGELAYWLQLKELFHHYNVFYPILVLRNSFLIIPCKWKKLLDKLSLEETSLFEPDREILKTLVMERTDREISLNGNLELAEEMFENIREKAGAIDVTLQKHVAAIRAKALKQLSELEKKMYRAEKKKFVAEQQQVEKLKQALFPENNLQERTENFTGFYARYGADFILEIYRHSLTFEQEFTILTESPCT